MEEISIVRVFETLINKIKWIILVAILGAIIGFVYSNFFIDKQYKAVTTLVMPKSGLIDEYTEMIKTDIFLESVSQRFGVSVSELKSKIYIDLKDKKTYDVHIVYKGQDPQLVTEISLELANKFVAEMIYNYQLDNVRVTQRPEVPTSYFNYNQNIVMSNVTKTCIAFTAIYIIFILSIEFFSNKVKTEGYVSDTLKIKVLSTISKYDKKKNKEYYQIQCDNLVNRINKNCYKNKSIIMFSNAGDAKYTFEEILKSYSKLNKRVVVLNLDESYKIKPIDKLVIKNCAYSEVVNYIDEYDYVLINAKRIDGISLDERIFDIVDNIILFAVRNSTKISDLQKSIKILNNYDKLDDIFCVMVGESIFEENLNYRGYLTK